MRSQQQQKKTAKKKINKWEATKENDGIFCGNWQFNSIFFLQMEW